MLLLKRSVRGGKDYYKMVSPQRGPRPAHTEDQLQSITFGCPMKQTALTPGEPTTVFHFRKETSSHVASQKQNGLLYEVRQVSHSLPWHAGRWAQA